MITLRFCHAVTTFLLLKEHPHIGVCSFNCLFSLCLLLFVCLSSASLVFSSFRRAVFLIIFTCCQWFVFIFVLVVVYRTDATEGWTNRAATLPTSPNVGVVPLPTSRSLTTTSSADISNPLYIFLSFTNVQTGLTGTTVLAHASHRCEIFVCAPLTSLDVYSALGVTRHIANFVCFVIFLVLVLVVHLHTAMISFRPLVGQFWYVLFSFCYVLVLQK